MHHDRTPTMHGLPGRRIAAARRDGERGEVGRRDDRDRLGKAHRSIGPGQGGAQRLGGEALPCAAGRQDPAGLRRGQRRLDLALEIGDADLADEAAAPVLDQPEAIAEQRPMADIAQQPGPDLLARERARR